MSREQALFLHRRRLGWKNGGNLCPQSIGVNRQFAMRLAHALSHSPEPDAHSLGLNLCESFLRNSPTVILNLHINLLRFASDTDYRSFAARVAMDVGQAFLNETKYGELYIRGDPCEVARNVQVNTEVAALGQTVCVPAKRRR